MTEITPQFLRNLPGPPSSARPAPFSEQSLEDLGDLLRLGVLQALPAGGVLFEEGERGSSFYLVVEGRLAASILGGEQTRALADVHPGDLVGATAIYRKETVHPTRVVALDPSVVLRLDNSVLAAFSAARSPLARALEELALDNLARSVRFSNEALAEVLKPQTGLSSTLRRLTARLLGGR